MNLFKLTIVLYVGYIITLFYASYQFGLWFRHFLILNGVKGL